MTTIKSIHIKECWPYEYVKPDRRVFKRETKDRANARKRAQYQAKKLLKLKVYDMGDDICERLNNA
jgi:hypothetical protein